MHLLFTIGAKQAKMELAWLWPSRSNEFNGLCHPRATAESSPLAMMTVARWSLSLVTTGLRPPSGHVPQLQPNRHGCVLGSGRARTGPMLQTDGTPSARLASSCRLL